MDTLRQIGGSLLLALFSVALVIGGISLALAESYVPVIPTPTETQALMPVIDTFTPTTEVIASFTATLPTPTQTIPPPPTSCPPPAGWNAVLVQPGDTLAKLALLYKSTPEQLLVANCLFSSDLPTGSIVYVPPFPTPTTIPCGPPPGWVRYTVRPGNTLTSLSLAFGVTVTQLQFANCMPANQFGLAAGQVIWVPNVATRTPRATATATLTPVSIVFPTLTWTPSLTPSPTNTLPPTATPTATLTFTATATLTASPTAPPTATATITSFPTATPTTPSPPSQ
jgi:LysM repeat protein